MSTTAKFQRDYLLSIQGNNGSNEVYSVKPPLTVEFDIVRNVFAGANTGKFRIYNLSENTRNNLFHVRYDSLPANYQRIQMFAGYGTRALKPMIFLGNVRSASTQRVGTDWITEIDAFDGGVGMLVGQVSIEKDKSGWTAAEILKTLVGKMDFVKFGSVGNITVQNSRGVSMAGNAWDICNRLADGALSFIDMNTAYFINENEYLARPGQVELILGPNNIIGTPRRQAGVMEVDMIFEPSVFVAQAVEVKSLQTIYNGHYQLRGIHHRGTISEAVCGEAITTLTLWTGIDIETGKIETK